MLHTSLLSGLEEDTFKEALKMIEWLWKIMQELSADSACISPYLYDNMLPVVVYEISHSSHGSAPPSAEQSIME